jgi:hypothetical protein
MRVTRRQFLDTSLLAGLALPALGRLPATAAAARRLRPERDSELVRESSVRALLRAGGSLPEPLAMPRQAAASGTPLALRYSDLFRHFVFEYYPWYANDPFRHWQQDGRNPPADLAANYMPFLGAYDSRAAAVVERHARWIADSGVGSVNLSWWGKGSFQDLATPLVLDVMRDHGVKVTFHLEPYSHDHGLHFAEDVLHLLREYGEKRRFDAFLLLRDEGGATGPLFKGFRTLLPPVSKDCHGASHPTHDYTPDDAYVRQFEALRNTLRGDFDHITLLADTTDARRAQRAGFDGIAIYDNFVGPELYATLAARATGEGAIFSFNTNPGYDGIEPRVLEPGSCHHETPFEPSGPDLDFGLAGDRERAAVRSKRRIATSFSTTLDIQTDPAFSNDKRGFLLVYVTSFNEWHEGHAFEPMRNAADLSPEERPFGYHNPAQGDYRLAFLGELMGSVLRPQAADARSRLAGFAPADPMG